MALWNGKRRLVSLDANEELPLVGTVEHWQFSFTRYVSWKFFLIRFRLHDLAVSDTPLKGRHICLSHSKNWLALRKWHRVSREVDFFMDFLRNGPFYLLSLLLLLLFIFIFSLFLPFKGCHKLYSPSRKPSGIVLLSKSTPMEMNTEERYALMISQVWPHATL